MHQWVKMQENGIGVLCEEHEAEGVVIGGKAYWGEDAIDSLVRRPNELEDALVEIAIMLSEPEPPIKEIDKITLATNKAELNFVVAGAEINYAGCLSGVASIFARKVKNNQMTIEAVPLRWRDEVQNQQPRYTNNQ